MSKKSPDIKFFFHEQLDNQLRALVVLPSLTLPLLNKIVIDTLSQTKGMQKAAGEPERIGYVSGVISGQGDDKIAENLALLSAWVAELQSKNDFPIFGPTSIYRLLAEMKLPKDAREEEFDVFWNAIVAQVTDVFMTPGWENGRGTKVEFDQAVRMSKQLHFPQEDEV